MFVCVLIAVEPADHPLMVAIQQVVGILGLLQLVDDLLLAIAKVSPDALDRLSNGLL